MRATFDCLIPSFAPLFIEDSMEAAAHIQLLPGEIPLEDNHLREIVIGACFIGVEAVAIELGFDRNRMRYILLDSVYRLSQYPMIDRKNAAILAHNFSSYPIIRADSPFDDWICEAIWKYYQTIPYQYPSVMSEMVAQGLRIIHASKQFELSIDEEMERSALERLRGKGNQ